MLNKQQGTAIIVALFVTALVAAAAVTMLTRLQMDIYRTELLINTTRAELAAQGSIAWAIDQLNNNLKRQRPNAIPDLTPIHSPLNKLNNMEIMSTVYDAQAYFNINNLKDPTYQEDFVRLLHIVEPKLDNTALYAITFAIKDWISSSAKSTDNDYLKFKPPYKPAHQLMRNISELRLVKGISAALLVKLSPYIIALPEVTPINFNHAPAVVLMSLSPTLSLESAKDIENTLQASPLINIEAFLNLPSIKTNPIPTNKITLTSSFFLVETDVKVGQQHITLYTLLQRIIKNGQLTELIRWQSKSTL